MITKRIETLEAIKRVIEKRRNRGSTEDNIKLYKNRLITKVWGNSDLEFKEEILNY